MNQNYEIKGGENRLHENRLTEHGGGNNPNYNWSNQRMEAIAAAIERTKQDPSLSSEERESRLRDYRQAMRSVN